MPETFTNDIEELARYAKAIGHPTRIKMLKFLSETNTCFSGKFQEILPYAPSTVSQHLSELKKAKLIDRKVIYPNVKYCINKKNWEEAQRLFRLFFDMGTDESL